ncbi:MAG: oligosaccharide flippase family protein [Opitutales bacterium]|nr:oligosaccharide flippase family protein [Opitutales bacterium]
MADESKQKNYRAVFKATSIFGGAQVFLILISILRAKVIAVLLGAVGFGVYNLFNSTILLASGLSNLGLPFSAVRDISYAHSKGDEDQIAKTILSFRRLVWLTGIAGALIMAIFCAPISNWTFHNYDKSFEFALAGFVVFLSAISSGQLTLLRGVRRIADCAKATVFSGLCGLLASLPIYWIWGIEGIVPSLIIGAAATLAISYLYSKKVAVKKVEASWKESFFIGAEMVKIGILVTLAGIVTQFASWLIYIFVSRVGGLEEVGLYAAGWAMTNQYTNIVFSAMGADYLPRIAAIKDDNEKVSEAANQQSEIALLIIGPAMVLFLSMLPLAIYVLFSAKFLSIIKFVQWMLLGMAFKTVSWALGFLVLGKGDSKTFIYTEVGIKLISIPSYLLGYYYLGLEGIGIAFCIVYISYLALMSAVCMKTYSFKYSKEHVKIFLATILATAAAFVPLYIWGYPVAYITGFAVFAMSLIYSLIELHKRLDLKEIVLKFKRKIYG